MRQIGALATSVEKLAISMQSMLKEQEKQGKRLEVLEGRDGEKWRRSWATLPRRLRALYLATCLRRSVCEEARECEE